MTKLINYKALQDLGVSKKNCFTNWILLDNHDISFRKRLKYKKLKNKYGIDDRETWNWGDEYIDYIYIHLKRFNEINNVDFEAEEITFEDETMSVQEAIDEILYWLEHFYYPNKDDTIDINKYKDYTKYNEDIYKWLKQKHRIIQLFAEIIEHLTW